MPPVLEPCPEDDGIVYCADPPSPQYDVIIIGAGVAGSALAYALGTQGRCVLLIVGDIVERDLSEPDRIVGELMQPGGIQALQQLGLEDCVENIDGITNHGYLVYQEGKQVKLDYPTNPATGRPYAGKSFHHGRFVDKLRKACGAVKRITVKEGMANSLIVHPLLDRVIGAVYTPTQPSATGNGKPEPIPVIAPITVVANGGSSKFRKCYLTKQPTGSSQFYGFIIRDCPLLAPGNGHVFLNRVSPVLMYQIDSSETRVLVDVPNESRKQFDGDVRAYLREVVIPDIPKSLQPHFVEATSTEKLRAMPNRFLPPSINSQDGLIYVGDSLNMRHPLTGGGMTVALWDVVYLRDLLAPNVVPTFEDTHLVLAQLQAFHWTRKQRSTAINILAQALYALFSARDDPDLTILRQACFDYFELGGNCVATPMGLLGGVCNNPWLLMYHFFAVVVYGMWCFLWSSPNPVAFVRNLLRTFSVFWMGCKVFLPLLWTEVQP